MPWGSGASCLCPDFFLRGVFCVRALLKLSCWAALQWTASCSGWCVIPQFSERWSLILLLGTHSPQCLPAPAPSPLPLGHFLGTARVPWRHSTSRLSDVPHYLRKLVLEEEPEVGRRCVCMCVCMHMCVKVCVHMCVVSYL